MPNTAFVSSVGLTVGAGGQLHAESKYWIVSDDDELVDSGTTVSNDPITHDLVTGDILARVFGTIMTNRSEFDMTCVCMMGPY